MSPVAFLLGIYGDVCLVILIDLPVARMKGAAAIAVCVGKTCDGLLLNFLLITKGGVFTERIS